MATSSAISPNRGPAPQSPRAAPVAQRHGPRHLFWRGVVAALGGAAMGAGVYPLAPALGLRWTSARRGRRSPQSLRLIASEWALAVATTAARPLAFAGVPTLGRRGPRPIILVHGYAMGRSSFALLAPRLARGGLGPLYGFEYWSLGPAAAAARRLGRFVEEVCDATGAEKVDLVGHSMGGVVCRYYATLAGGTERVAHIVTLGSPHGGTGVSVFGIGRPTVELVPGSTLLSRLAVPPAEVDATYIWSRADALVWAARQARWPGAREIVYDDVGHIGLLASRRVAADIVSLLES